LHDELKVYSPEVTTDADLGIYLWLGLRTSLITGLHPAPTCTIHHHNPVTEEYALFAYYIIAPCHGMHHDHVWNTDQYTLIKD